jgi:hypothetical protein
MKLSDEAKLPSAQASKSDERITEKRYAVRLVPMFYRRLRDYPGRAELLRFAKAQLSSLTNPMFLQS